MAEEKKINHFYRINDLKDFIKFTRVFSNGDTIWYRGHADRSYSLLPSLYRGKTIDFSNINTDTGYTSIHYAEDVRIQQYYAKNYDFIKNNGINTTEWLGMAQHFGIYTRFLDWSTSAFHSLVFALDHYFDSTVDVKKHLPCIWLLKPQVMNKKIIEQISTNDDIHNRYVNRLNNISMCDKTKIKEYLKQAADASHNNVFLQSNPSNDWDGMDYIYDLAYFDRLLKRFESDSVASLCKGTINPWFLIMADAYINGISFGDKLLSKTPLAIIHPLNSSRINAQKGVFTIFPFPTKCEYEKNNNIDYMKMEFNPELKGMLCKMEITNPYLISKELKMLGVRKTWLFNEPDYISREIESGL